MGPHTYGFDDDITVELWDKAGKIILDSTKAVSEKSVQKGTTQSATETTYPVTEQKFRFEGKPDGKYKLVFILHKNGIPQPAIKFPTIYAHKSHKLCDSIYMLEP